MQAPKINKEILRLIIAIFAAFCAYIFTGVLGELVLRNVSPNTGFKSLGALRAEAAIMGGLTCFAVGFSFAAIQYRAAITMILFHLSAQWIHVLYILSELSKPSGSTQTMGDLALQNLLALISSIVGTLLGVYLARKRFWSCKNAGATLP